MIARALMRLQHLAMIVLAWLLPESAPAFAKSPRYVVADAHSPIRGDVLFIYDKDTDRVFPFRDRQSAESVAEYLNNSDGDTRYFVSYPYREYIFGEKP